MSAIIPARLRIALAPIGLAQAAEHRKLHDRAFALWPDSLDFADHNRREWLRAVRVVKSTKLGWLLERENATTKRELGARTC